VADRADVAVYDDVAVCTWHRTRDDVADRTEGHVAAPGRATCHTYLAFSGYGLANKKVTRVTTHRVTRGTMTSAVTWQPYTTWARQVTQGDASVRQRHTWANERPTRGTSRLVEKGATWPNQGLPRGTLGFANIGYVKSFWVNRARTGDLPDRNALA
jgi:hypothetical protein